MILVFCHKISWAIPAHFDRSLELPWRISVKKGLVNLGILTKLKGVNVGILITSFYVDPVRFCCGGIFFVPAEKAQDVCWEELQFLMFCGLPKIAQNTNLPRLFGVGVAASSDFEYGGSISVWCVHVGTWQAWVAHNVKPLKRKCNKSGWWVSSQKPHKKHKLPNKLHQHGVGAARPSTSNGVDLIIPCRPRGRRPCTYTFRVRHQRILFDWLK